MGYLLDLKWSSMFSFSIWKELIAHLSSEFVLVVDVFVFPPRLNIFFSIFLIFAILCIYIARLCADDTMVSGTTFQVVASSAFAMLVFLGVDNKCHCLIRIYAFVYRGVQWVHVFNFNCYIIYFMNSCNEISIQCLYILLYLLMMSLFTIIS